jgi:hypothetical protein
VKKLASLLLIFAATPASAQVAVTFNTPAYGFNVIPGSVRNYNAIITGGTGNLVNWSVIGTTGGASATLSASTNALPEVTVTFGATGGNCSISGKLGSYVVSSTATVTLQAQSVDDVTKTSSTTVKVCTPAVQIAVVPSYRTLYRGQKADIQSFIVGSTNMNVTWAITNQPAGGDGALDDTTNRDTVFSATVAGRYTLTATSVADGTQTVQTIMYVTGNTQPYAVTPNLTEPIDCTTDPGSTGVVYEVGPERAYTTIQSVPMDTMVAGSTVRIHNDDLTGLAPTTYTEYFQIKTTNGTLTQPIRVVGCPDALGNLPIVEGVNATGASWVSTGAAAGYSLGTISGNPPTVFGYYQSGNPPNGYITIEGLHFRDAGTQFNYTPPAGGSAVPYVSGVACVAIRDSINASVTGNDIENCQNGFLFDANTDNNAWKGSVLWTLIEGNHIHQSGVIGFDGFHQAYLEGWGQVIQFNRLDNYKSGALGNQFKLRAIFDVLRYNYADAAAGFMTDMVEIQDSQAYEDFNTYLGLPGATDCNTSFWCLGDTMGPNIVSAWQEAYHQQFIYGNTFKNDNVAGTGSVYLHHFGEDNFGGMLARKGTLYYYNNIDSMIVGGANPTQVLFDTSGGGGGDNQDYEFRQIIAANNIAWAPSPVAMYWNKEATILATFQTNLMQTGWGNITTPINGGNIGSHTGNGWSNLTNAYSYALAVPLDPHMSGISAGNFLTTSKQPFSSTTFIPSIRSAAIGAGSALSGAMAVMPVRFNYSPSTSMISPRVSPDTIGALDPTYDAVTTQGSSQKRQYQKQKHGGSEDLPSEKSVQPKI